MGEWKVLTVNSSLNLRNPRSRYGREGEARSRTSSQHEVVKERTSYLHKWNNYWCLNSWLVCGKGSFHLAQLKVLGLKTVGRHVIPTLDMHVPKKVTKISNLVPQINQPEQKRIKCSFCFFMWNQKCTWPKLEEIVQHLSQMEMNHSSSCGLNYQKATTIFPKKLNFLFCWSTNLTGVEPLLCCTSPSSR